MHEWDQWDLGLARDCLFVKLIYRWKNQLPQARPPWICLIVLILTKIGGIYWWSIAKENSRHRLCPALHDLTEIIEELVLVWKFLSWQKCAWFYCYFFKKHEPSVISKGKKNVLCHTWGSNLQCQYYKPGALPSEPPELHNLISP